MTFLRPLPIMFAFAMLLAADISRAQRIPLAPRLHPGQTLTYQIDLSGSRSTKVESKVTAPQSPPSTSLNAFCLLHVEVAEASARGFRLKTYLSEKASAQISPGPSSGQAASAPDKLVEVLVAADGSASEITGLDKLSPEQQYAWSAWLSRFASVMTFPKAGARRGQRWELSEPETSPSLIAGLSWERKYEYVKQEFCNPSLRNAATDKSGKPPPLADLCAVVLVRAQLRQKSSPKDATPQDYKLRGLVTSGSAAGENETILYISATTGLLMRSNEDVQQSMDVTVALADGSNQVRYRISAKSRSQIQLLSDFPQDAR
jgi:hypothetical protein